MGQLAMSMGPAMASAMPQMGSAAAGAGGAMQALAGSGAKEGIKGIMGDLARQRNMQTTGSPTGGLAYSAAQPQEAGNSKSFLDDFLSTL